MILTFFIYFSIVERSDWEVTLLVVIMRLQWSEQTMSIIISDLIFLRNLLILEIWLSDNDMNLEILLSSIGIMIYLLEEPFVAMLIQGFFFLSLLIDLWIFSIFFDFQYVFDIR